MGISSSLGSSALLPAGLGFRNMVINGNFAIDQRNAGVAQSGQTTDFYAVDRFVCSVNASGNFTGQQVALSTLGGTQPAGFTYALGCTAASGRTAAAGDVYGLRHRIEGFNSAQLSWGASNAKSVTLSFWVRSSVTGTYNVGFFNAAANRSLVTSYTIITANTWEYKTIFVTGDATGTWGIGNGVGVEIFWDLGSGSTYNVSTLNTWTAGIFVTSAASTKWIATASATFYITGVQLEQNYQPTPFEQRPIGVELELCQRYCISRKTDYAITNGWTTTNGQKWMSVSLPTTMRIAPNTTIYDALGTAGKVSTLDSGGSGTNNVTVGFQTSFPTLITALVSGTHTGMYFGYFAECEL
jgi:hypothetical protein